MGCVPGFYLLPHGHGSVTGSPQLGPGSSRYAFAASIEADRAEILAEYVRKLDEIGSPVVRDPVSREQVTGHADQILDDVIASVRAGGVRLEDRHLLAWDIGEARAASGVHPRESLRAAEVLFDVTVAVLRRHLSADSDSFIVGVLAMNRSISARIGEAVIAYAGFLLNKIHEAHIEERWRIARDLHDRIGHGLSVAHQQLEMYDVYRETEPIRAAARVEVAQQALDEAMLSLRAAISGLRLDVPARSLEKALVAFVEDVRPDNVDIHVWVNGDETWASAAVRDESFLVLREAVRNALNHGAPTVVVVRGDVAPHELRASVKDDGRGFDPAGRPQSGGVGLSSMRERAELMGGTLLVSSEPGRGTQIELLVPLPGYRR
jgi:signal transduction histidine kinase